MKKKIFFICKLIFGFGLLGYLVAYKTDPAAILAVLKGISWPLAVAAFLLHAVGLLISAIRWKLLLDEKGSPYSIRQLMQYYLVGIFFSHFLPSRFGGDVVRVSDTRDIPEGMAASLAVVVYERLSGIVALMVFALVSALIKLKFTMGFPFIYLTLLAGFVFLALLILLWLKLPRDFVSHWKPRWPFLARIVAKLSVIHAVIYDFLKHKKIQQRVVFWAFLLQLNVVIHYYLIGMALKTTRIPFLDYFFIIPILLFILSVPLSINGIGVRDLTMIKFFSLYGYGASYAIGFSLLDVLFNLILGVIGGLIYSLRKK